MLVALRHPYSPLQEAMHAALSDNMLIAGYNKDTVYNYVETVIDTLVHDG